VFRTEGTQSRVFCLVLPLLLPFYPQKLPVESSDLADTVIGRPTLCYKASSASSQSLESKKRDVRSTIGQHREEALQARSGPCTQLAYSDPGIPSSFEGPLLDQTGADEAAGAKSSEEILALCKGAYAASSSSIHGAGMRAAVYAARVRD
jgi:hypothetical protein